MNNSEIYFCINHQSYTCMPELASDKCQRLTPIRASHRLLF
jgi:hypothetical protein